MKLMDVINNWYGHFVHFVKPIVWDATLAASEKFSLKVILYTIH